MENLPPKWVNCAVGCIATAGVAVANLKVGNSSFQIQKPSTGGFLYLEVTGIEPASERACDKRLQV